MFLVYFDVVINLDFLSLLKFLYIYFIFFISYFMRKGIFVVCGYRGGGWVGWGWGLGGLCMFVVFKR